MADEVDTNGAATTADPLARFRLRRCVKCDYDLAGLPPEHCCPECGEAYSHDTLELVGWSQPGFVPGTFMRWVHIAVYIVVGVFGLFMSWTSGMAAGGFWIWAGPLAYCALVGWIVFARRMQARSGGNLRLIVAADHLVLDTGYPTLLDWLTSSQADEILAFGGELSRLAVRRRRADVWEFYFTAGPFRSLVLTRTAKIVLKCSEAEAQELAHELRLRIARAIERRAHA